MEFFTHSEKGNKLKILITGASGFIGSHLAEQLLEEGAEVRLFVRNSKEIGLRGEERMEKVIGDILELDSILKALNGVDIVFHLAAELRMGLVSADLLTKVNSNGAKNVITACRKKKISKLIFSSSVGVLGDIKKPPASENYPPQPEDDYEISKYQGEKLALKAAEEGLRVIIIRPAWVYGPRDKRTLKLFRIINKGRMFLIGNGKNLQHPVYVTDVVQSMILASRKEVKNGSTYHIAGDRILTLNELLKLCASNLGSKILPLHFPLFLALLIAWITEPLFKKFNRESPLTKGKLGFFIKNRAYSIRKAEKELGYKPTISLENGLQQTFKWYKEHNML